MEEDSANTSKSVVFGSDGKEKEKKNLPAMQETWVQSLDWADPLEKGMATHSNILHWRIPWTEEPEKAGLKLNVWKIEIMASGPINANRRGKRRSNDRCFLGLQSHYGW